eukprot:Protomagalhaensia_sp_Gyna_25__1288@NODE_1646_length_1663_cov_28_963670_g1345_i0_p2_GENE_NODE_1646_length_1663_cov_28_963670_g1345_i0NODE_1646_length_1663_cov_28_963670_g1345_i0_p2_ORF_typecomplete_len160_score32_99_NODE_1646_length_1663_cov_28_963670_g1345_i059538
MHGSTFLDESPVGHEVCESSVMTNALYYPLLSSLVGDPYTIKLFLSSGSDSLCGMMGKDVFDEKEFRCKSYSILLRSILRSSPNVNMLVQTLKARSNAKEAAQEAFLQELSLLHPEAFDTLAFKKIWAPMAFPPKDFSEEYWNATMKRLQDEGFQARLP